jgi:hypothetical protein
VGLVVIVVMVGFEGNGGALWGAMVAVAVHHKHNQTALG